MTYLLDTNVCIEVIRRRGASIIERILSQPVGEIAIGTVTVAELEYGVAKSAQQARNKVALLQFLAPFEILPFDQEAAQQYGIIWQHLEIRGERIGPMDLLIAAQHGASSRRCPAGRRLRREPGCNQKSVACSPCRSWNCWMKMGRSLPTSLAVRLSVSGWTTCGCRSLTRRDLTHGCLANSGRCAIAAACSS